MLATINNHKARRDYFIGDTYEAGLALKGVEVKSLRAARASIDEAFARRMSHIVEFPFPDVALRQQLWRQCLPAEAPLNADVNFAALANQFHVTGGNIRNITLAAAFVASEQGCVIGMDHLIRATARELVKIGRQPSRAEFDNFYSLVQHPQ